MSILAIFRRSWQAKGKSLRNRASGRRLAIEALEQRALFSVAPSLTMGPIAPSAIGVPPASTAQRLTLADLPTAAQQAISSAIGQEAKLTSSDGVADDNFGDAVAIDGNTVAVEGAGGVCVFTGSGYDWTQVAKLTPSNAAAQGDFGTSIAISGATIVVGAPNLSGLSSFLGTVYLFTESAAGWANMTQTAELTASNGTANDYFRGSVAISGNTVVVGAVQATVGGNADEGAAYVFTEPASGWANMTQTAELTAADGAAGDLFAGSVSISGNTVVVGAQSIQSILPNPGPGAAYVFSEPGSGWVNMTQTAKLTASDGLPGDNFGDSVSISGNTVVVGSTGISTYDGKTSPAAAYVFSEPGSGWADMTQTAELTASGGGYSCFGSSVSISGDTVVVGAQYATIGGNSEQGAAYVFTEPASGWANMTQTAELTASDGTANANFGSSVAISGNTVLVGAWLDTSMYVATRQNAVYTFTEPDAGWTNMNQETKLTASDGAYADDLADSVAVSGNTVVVGASDATVGGIYNQGAVYVFIESAAGWTDMTQVATLTSSDGVADDGFGSSVAISGNTIVVGAPRAVVDGTDNLGAAYVFTEPGTGWANMTQSAKLTRSTVAPVPIIISVPIAVQSGGLPEIAAGGQISMSQTASLTASNGLASNDESAASASALYDGNDDYEEFGASVAISGNTVVVGACCIPPPCLPPYRLGPGAAYVFTEPSTGWANMTQTAKLTPSDGSFFFGTSVAISGNTVVVGAVTYAGDLDFFAFGGPSPAAAYVFTEPNEGWANMTQTAKLTASDGAAYYEFGDSVAISGSTIVVGSPFSTVAGGAEGNVQGAGAAYVFMEPGTGWENMTQSAKLTASDGAANDYFGDSVAIDANTIVVGAGGASIGGPTECDGESSDKPGTAYVFTEPVSGWENMTQTEKVIASDGLANDYFGDSVAISGKTVVVGAPQATVGVNVDQGAAYIFGTATGGSSMAPAITSPAVQSAIVGQSYAYQVKTYVGAGQKIAFSLGAAPAGMSINASTGLVTWVPNILQMGSSAVTVQARDQFGDTTQQTFSLSVYGPLAPYDPFAPVKRELTIVGPVNRGLI